MILHICDTVAVLKIMRLVKILITGIRIVVPILLILSLMIDFFKAISSKDNDALAKASAHAVQRATAALIIFFVPLLIDIIVNYVDDSVEYKYCLINATSEKIKAATIEEAQFYVDEARKNPTAANVNRAKYEIADVKDEVEIKRLTEELGGAEKVVSAYEEANSNSGFGTGMGTSGWWFPVGGAEKQTINGVDFASGAPVGTHLTAYFGGNDDVHKNLGHGHGAIDVGVAQGTYVIASRSGIVTRPTKNERIDYPNSYIKKNANGKYDCTGLVANTVAIDHQDGTDTRYLHLLANTITVRAGDYVRQGQIIGLVGSSGCSTGAHLHFEVRVNGTKVDPLNYVSTTYTRH